MENSSKSNVAGMLLVACGTTLFAFIAVPVKLVQESMPSLLLIELRALIQCTIGLIGIIIAGLRPWQPTEERKWLLLWAINYWLYVFTYYQALHALPLGDAITLVYLGPIFGSIVARATLGEVLPWSFFPCSLLALLGGVLVSQPSFIFGDGAPAHWTGYVIAIIAAFFGGNIGCISRALPGRHWLELPTVGLGLAALIFNPVAVTVDLNVAGVAPYTSVEWTARLIGFVGCIGVGGFVAIVLQVEGYKRANVVAASMLSYSEVPIAYLLQYIFFGNAVTIVGVIGSGLVLVSMGASSLLNRKKSTQEDASAQQGEPCAEYDEARDMKYEALEDRCSVEHGKAESMCGSSECQP